MKLDERRRMGQVSRPEANPFVEGDRIDHNETAAEAIIGVLDAPGD